MTCWGWGVGYADKAANRYWPAGHFVENTDDLLIVLLRNSDGTDPFAILWRQQMGPGPAKTGGKNWKAPDLLTSRKYTKAPDLLVILIRELVSVLSLQKVRDCSPEVHVVKGALQKLFIIVNSPNLSNLQNVINWARLCDVRTSHWDIRSYDKCSSEDDFV
jgi:hypothetical protein